MRNIGYTEPDCNSPHLYDFSAECLSMDYELSGYKERWQRITEGMQRCGFTSQKTLAKRLGIKQPSISGWKNGDHLPDNIHMIRLADWSGLCVEWIWSGRGPKFPDPSPGSAAERLIAIMEAETDQFQDELLLFAEYMKAAKGKS